MAVEDGCTLAWGSGNTDMEPMFVDYDNGDYHLHVCSPLVNAGDPTFTLTVGETDIDGDGRITGTTVDMGADEVPHTDYNSNGIPDECETLENVPALSGWGMITMTLLGLSAGTLLLARQRTAQP